MASWHDARTLLPCDRCGVVFSMTAKNGRSSAAHYCPWCRMSQRRRRPNDADRQ